LHDAIPIFVNVHALGGSEMIKRAKEGLQTNSTYDTKLLAVTVLTSMDNQVINREMGLGGTVTQEVTRLAKLSEDSGASGVVCSVHEAALIKETTQPNFVTMTPGISLLDDQTNDQKRVVTSKFAIKAVQIETENYFTWTSGIKSPIYCDNRLTMSYPEVRKRIIDGFINKIKTFDVQPDVIAGCATAGIPHAAWIADRLNLPMVY